MPDSPVRLLYVIENERYGGGERAFAALAAGMGRARYDVSFACLTGTPGSAALERELDGRARLFRLDLRRLVSPGAAAALKKIIAGVRADIVHSQGPRADFYARLSARAAGGALTVSTVASPVEEYDVSAARKLLYSAVDSLSARLCDRFVPVAEHIARKLEAKGVPAGRIELIRNGVDAASFRQAAGARDAARLGYGAGSGDFLAAACSRLSPEKGLFTLLEAAAALRSSGARFKCAIAGDGPLRGRLEARAAELGLGAAAVFTGFLSDVRPLLAAADVFVLPSLREGMPLGLLEAMAAGKPAVASDIAGVDEVVEDGRNGLLVPPGDAAALAAGLRLLMDDPKTAASMGESAAADAAGKFGLDSFLAAHDAMYSKLVGSRNG